jgi:hypothetical protein
MIRAFTPIAGIRTLTGRERRIGLVSSPCALAISARRA